MGKAPIKYVEIVCEMKPLSLLFFGKLKDLPEIMIFFVKFSLSAFLTILKKPRKFFLSSDLIGRVLASGLFIKVIVFPRFDSYLINTF